MPVWGGCRLSRMEGGPARMEKKEGKRCRKSQKQKTWERGHGRMDKGKKMKEGGKEGSQRFACSTDILERIEA